jgi:hypothetical protein
MPIRWRSDRQLRLDASRYRFGQRLFRLPALIIFTGMLAAVLLLAADRSMDTER